MKLTLNGQEYQAPVFSLLNVSVGEARTIKRQTGMTISDWRLGLLTIERQDPDVLAAVVFILRHRAGEDVDWADVDKLSTMELARSVVTEPGDYELPAELQDLAPDGEVEEVPAAETELPEVEPEPPKKPAPKKPPAKRTPKPKAAA